MRTPSHRQGIRFVCVRGVVFLFCFYVNFPYVFGPLCLKRVSPYFLKFYFIPHPKYGTARILGPSGAQNKYYFKFLFRPSI